MNKRETILGEAKRLFGRYGYLGFTLKQLAQACSMTSPALYYFYSSKAELFKDCLLSEMESRRQLVEDLRGVSTLGEFAREFCGRAIDLCDLHGFRTGQAIQETIHLPSEMQTELREAWDRLVIGSMEEAMARLLPAGPSSIPRPLVATFVVNMATFASTHQGEYTREAWSALFVAVADGVAAVPSRP
jgi:AcrR family transcriptional regulator